MGISDAFYSAAGFAYFIYTYGIFIFLPLDALAPMIFINKTSKIFRSHIFSMRASIILTVK